MTRPPFPLVWDNTMRVSFITCPQRFAWEYLRHFKHTAPSTDLHAGKAWAHALETARMAFYGDKVPSEDAIALGLEALVQSYGDFTPPKNKENKSLDRLIQAWLYYFKAFPFDLDPVQPLMNPYTGKPMVEFSFVLPLDPELVHPETGEPLLYSGRADMLASYAGAASVYDDKTTSSLGPKWAEQWDRRSQFTGYCWAAQAYGLQVSQVVVRGIAILKTDINHAQAITPRSPHHIEEWHHQIKRDLKRAIECWKEGFWDKNLADACASYGSCLFKQPCSSPNPEPWLTGGNYAVRVWNPATRSDDEVTPNV